MQGFKLKMLSTAVGAVALLGASSVFAGITANLENGKNIFNNGKGDVPACNSCHGPQGMGDDNTGAPRLAGQVFQFVVKQLEDFATDKRQDTTMYVMNANAKGLNSQDRIDVAAYVNSLPTVEAEFSKLGDLKANGTTVGETYLGKILVNYGVPERGIPACKSCHDYNGRGVDPVYPRIGGQKYVYLVNQLKKWRDGSRANDPLAQMQKVAQKLSDEDINNVAAFLTTAPPTTMGNSRVPSEHLPFRH